VRVRYAGPPERLPQVSYADVLDGHVDGAMLHGRRIVVGMTGLAIVVIYFRNRGSIQVEDVNLMKG